MTTYLKHTLADIRNKVRRITGKPSVIQISDDQIDDYINTFYVFDMPEHLRLESLKVNYQFLTVANVQVYDFPTELYLTTTPPVFIAGYQSFMTQSREAFFRINTSTQYLQGSLAIGNGSSGPYSGTLTATPILKGFKPNPPGAISLSKNSDIEAKFINWNVLISGLDATGKSISLIDDGQGNLFDPTDTSTIVDSATSKYPRGTIDYSTGVVSIGVPPLTGFKGNIASGQPINAQYVPYKASRPQSTLFFNDQIMVYPVPDQAYTVSFEAFKYPTAFATDGTEDALSPQLNEWWQLLAYGAADKIFADDADFENMQKFRPLLDEQMRLVQRRTIQQYSSERTATIYTEQNQLSQFPFGNLFGGI